MSQLLSKEKATLFIDVLCKATLNKKIVWLASPEGFSIKFPEEEIEVFVGDLYEKDYLTKETLRCVTIQRKGQIMAKLSCEEPVYRLYACIVEKMENPIDCIIAKLENP